MNELKKQFKAKKKSIFVIIIKGIETYPCFRAWPTGVFVDRFNKDFVDSLNDKEIKSKIKSYKPQTTEEEKIKCKEKHLGLNQKRNML